MTRADHVVALGGGVVGDLAGFCAATYQRGVPVVQVPTTLVAQVDSAYGGKTGVDLAEAKNYVGAYHQPAGVLVDPDTLATLPAAELAAGWVEVLKTALIAGGGLWEAVAEGGEVDRAHDPRVRAHEARGRRRRRARRGRRQVLNLGHTVGHAIETATGYARYRHGEAVGLGLLAALALSGQAELRARVRTLMLERGLPVTFDGVRVDAVIEAIARDKKRVGDERAVRAGACARRGRVRLRGGARGRARRGRGARAMTRSTRTGRRIEVMHGVNLDQLGRRDPLLYGTLTLEQLERRIERGGAHAGPGHALLPQQPRRRVHRAPALAERPAHQADAILLNPGAWTHYAWAIRDALEIAALPALEIHLSDVQHREPWRRVSVIGELCFATVSGRGPDGYREALELLRDELEGRRRERRTRRERRARRGRQARCERRARRRPGPAGRPHGAAGGRARRARARRAARRFARQRALPDRLHRQQRAGAGARRGGGREARHASLPQRLPLREPVGRTGAGLVRARDRHRRPARGARRGALRAYGPARLRRGQRDGQGTPAARGALGEGWELVPCAGAVERLRAVKDAGEIARIRAASELADEALRGVLEDGLVGRTEREVAIELELRMRRLGAQSPSFPSIVAAGAHGALPHAEPRRQEIPADVLVTIDWGALLEGYCSDCTRTYATGERISTQAREIYALVLRAQEQGLDAVRAGRSGREVDAVAREVIEQAGHGEHFGHGLGHGVGLEIHEGPRLSRTAGDEPLRRRQRRHGRARRLPAGRARRADRGPGGRRRGLSGGADEPAQGADGRLLSARGGAARPGAGTH